MRMRAVDKHIADQEEARSPESVGSYPVSRHISSECVQHTPGMLYDFRR